MKKLILLMIFCLGMAIGGFSQVKAITKAQYDLVQENSQSKIDKIPRRVITTTISYENGKVASKETLTIETFLPDGERWNSITEKDGVVTDKLQIIYLGNYEYRKEGENDWKKTCVKNCSKSEQGKPYGIVGGKELPKVQQFLTLDTTIDNKPINFYIFYRVYDYGKTLNFYEHKEWINSDGLIIKEESKTSDVFPSNITSYETVTYEYNPKDIKPIEAPKMP
jgi:hypothetical protein